MKRFLLPLFLLLAISLKAATGDIQYVQIETNGWCADIYFTGLGTGGTYSYGFGQSNSISGNEKLVITVSSPGFNDTGGSNGFVRKVYGTLRLRKPYPNQAQADEKVLNTSDMLSRVALSERICTNDTLISCVVASGFYSDLSSHANNAANFTPTGLTNYSILMPPRCVAMWSQPDWFLVGSSYQMSLVAFHYSCFQGRPVRAVAFWAVDAQGNRSPTNFVLNPTIDRTQNGTAGTGIDPNKITEYVTTINGSNFQEGSPISNYFKIYPWWGPALDCSDGVNPPGNADYCPSVMYCDRTGAWPKVYALVDPAGNNANGLCVTNQVSWTNGTAVPFATIADAINAAGSTNNTINGSNVLSACFIGLTNGTYAWLGGPNVSSRNPANTWITVQARPDINNWSNAILGSVNNNLTMDKTTRLHVYHLVCQVSTLANTFGAGYADVLIDQCLVLTNNNGVNLVDSQTNCWFRQSTLLGQRNLSNPSGNQLGWTKARGCTYLNFDTVDGRTTQFRYVLEIGCTLPCTGNEEYGAANDSGVLCDPVIWCYNSYYRQNGLVYANTWGINANVTKGTVWVGNVYEGTANVGSSIPQDVMFSAKENELCTNELFWDNTSIGTYHPPFVQTVGTNITEEWYQDCRNVYGGLQAKADISGANGAFTNRWCDTFSVGRVGNYNANYLLTGTEPDGKELGYNGIYSSFFATTNAAIYNFVHNAGHGNLGGDATGLGDYHMTTASPIRGLYIPVYNPFGIDGRGARGRVDPPGAYVSCGWRRGGGNFGG